MKLAKIRGEIFLRIQLFIPLFNHWRLNIYFKIYGPNSGHFSPFSPLLSSKQTAYKCFTTYDTGASFMTLKTKHLQTEMLISHGDAEWLKKKKNNLTKSTLI